MTLTTPPYLCVQGKGHKFFIDGPNPDSGLYAISTPFGTKKRAYLQPSEDDSTIIVMDGDPQYVFQFVPIKD